MIQSRLPCWADVLNSIRRKLSTRESSVIVKRGIYLAVANYVKFCCACQEIFALKIGAKIRLQGLEVVELRNFF
jgi:hypothetical protein